jgi:hypothetical protein
MVSLASIRLEVEERLKGRVPAPFASRPPLQKSTISTGISEIDSLCRGIPIGAITEIVADRWSSAGRKSLMLQLLTRMTAEQNCVLVDANDSFDPLSASGAGVNLRRLLWVRCSGKGIKALEQAFASADLLLQGGCGFGLLILDLSLLAPEQVRKVPTSTWFRLRSVVERLQLPLVIATTHKVVGTCSALTLSLKKAEIQWSEAAEKCLAHGRLPMAINFRLQAEERHHTKKPVSAERVFRTEQKWA